MYAKNIKSFFPPGTRNVLLVVLVIGIGAFFYGWGRDLSILILGLIVALFSIFIMTGFYGIQIDFENKRYRNYLSFIYLLKFGAWKAMPEVTEIAVTPVKHFVSRHSLRENLYSEKFQIKLLGIGPSDSIVVSQGLYGEIILEAETLHKKLKVPIREF